MNINSVRSSSVDPWSSPADDTQPTAAPAAPAMQAPPRDASALPDLPDVHAGLLARAAQATQPPTPQATSTPHVLLATGLKAADVEVRIDAPNDGTRVVKERLDSFLETTKSTYHIPGEGDVAVAVPFRLWKPGRGAYPLQEDVVKANTGERTRIGSGAGLTQAQLESINVGRGSPQTIQRLTQALIIAGKLPPARPQETLANRVRRMMCDFGVGLDCAGYVQQAFLAAQGVTRSAAAFNPSIQDEALDLNGNARFSRASASTAVAGDIIALSPPPGETFGHRVIVYERHTITSAEISVLRGNDIDMKRARSGHVSVLEVDSSWGSSGRPEFGGVNRAKWVYMAAHDGQDERWGTIEGNRVNFTATGLPYDGRHPLLGVFHFRGTPSVSSKDGK